MIYPSPVQYLALARQQQEQVLRGRKFTTIVENGGAIVDGDFAGEVVADRFVKH